MPDSAHLTAFFAATVVLAAIPGAVCLIALGGYAAVGDRR